MYTLELTKNDKGYYWIKAHNEETVNLHFINQEKLQALNNALKVVLRQNLEFAESWFMIEKRGSVGFVFSILSGNSFFGYIVNKSRLTAFHNQIMGVLNG